MGKGVKSSREGGSKLESDRREGRCEMRKSVVVLTAVVLTLVLIVTPGLAAGGEGNGSTSLNLMGTISDITCPSEGEDGVITVAKTWPGTGNVEVVLTQDTLFKECTGVQGEGGESSCAYLVELLGEPDPVKVRIVGERDMTTEPTTYTARRVILLLEED